MIIHIGNLAFIAVTRNGFGVDIEATKSKPVHLTGQLDDGQFVETTGYFDGLVVLIPFSMLMLGRCYVFDES